MHIPTCSRNLKDEVFPQIRLGLQGASGTGKSWSALTFPNPIVVDYDGSLTAHAGKDIPRIPFHDAEFMDKYAEGKYKRVVNRVDVFPNRRDALLHFLQNDALKMTNEQTLIIDSWSAVQLAFDNQQALEPKRTKDGKEDAFDFWMKKIEYSEKLCTYFMSLKCHVVVTFHEDPVRDKETGKILEKLAPLMQGKFVVQLKRFFTDFFRCIAISEKDASNKDTGDTKYYWQVRSDSKFDAKTRLALGDSPSLVEPHFKIFEQYKNTK